MDLSLQPVLDLINRDGGAMRIANSARTPRSYFLETLLPERGVSSYRVDRSKMIVRSTMAGLVPMDTFYPKGGVVEVGGMNEDTAKIAIEQTFGEAQLRTLQDTLLRLGNSNMSTERMLQEFLNWYDKIVLQGIYDFEEYLRGQALTRGQINIQQNGTSLSVDYGIPAERMPDTSTAASGAAWHLPGSDLWTKFRSVRPLLRGGVTSITMNSATYYAAEENPENRLKVLSEGDGYVEVVRYDARDAGNVNSDDKRERLRIRLYDDEAESLRPDGTTVRHKFVEDGAVIITGRPQRRGYYVGQGSTDDPDNELALGYTHIAPTTEGTNEGNPGPGRWGEIGTVPGRAYQLRGAGVSNMLPVIENPEALVVLRTELPS